jgi:CRP-like cAMP-binding protein
MADGTTIEVGMVGLEGMTGLSALLGADVSAQLAIVQIPGTAPRMSATRCKTMFDQNATFRRISLRFTEAMLNLSAQTAACNRLHSTEQRCARWLLMASDRIGSDRMPDDARVPGFNARCSAPGSLPPRGTCSAPG